MTEHSLFLSPDLWIDRFFRRSKSDIEALRIAVHETLHIVVNESLNVPNTALTEALFDALCGREEAGLWFAQEVFNQIEALLS